MSARLLHVFATFVPGGPQVRTARLISALGPGWRHAIVAMDGRTDARELIADGIEVEILETRRTDSAMRSVRRLRSLIAGARPDLLLTYNWGAIEAVVAGRLAGMRALIHHEDGFLPDEAAAFKRRRVWARRIALRAVHAVVVPSHTLRSIATELWRLPPERVHWIPNGVEVGAFAPAGTQDEQRAELGIPAEAFVAGFVGHLRREKNPVRLIETTARLADTGIHVLLLGEGPERAAVEQAIRDRGLDARVHLVGHRADPRPYYRAMDAFVIPSDTEQMPVALLEAMASSLPVVATDVGDVARVLPPSQAGFVVPLAPGVEAGLARAIDTLAADRELARGLGRENRVRAEASYSFEGMLGAYRALFEGALRGCRPGGS